MPTAHERHRERLQAFVSGALAPVLESWRPGAGDWHRAYGRLGTGDDPWAVLVCVDPDGRAPVRVDLHLRDVEGAVDAGALGRAVLTTPQEDPRLNGLTAVLARLSDPVIVRYRPGQRCTLVGGTPEGRRFVKVAPDAEALHRDAAALWEVAAAGELTFAVARPHGWFPDTGSFWQGEVGGVSVLPELLGDAGPPLTRRMGRALAELACSSLDPSARIEVADQAARTERTAAGAVELVPGLAPRMEAVRAAYARWHARLAPREPVPVHGAPHAHQWLATPGGGLGLIDFDRCAWGEPELDAATLLAELDSEAGRRRPVAEHAEAMRAGYHDGGVQLDADRMALYLAHKRLARVRRLCWSLRPDGDARAAQHLGVVEDDLRGAGLL